MNIGQKLKTMLDTFVLVYIGSNGMSLQGTIEHSDDEDDSYIVLKHYDGTLRIETSSISAFLVYNIQPD